MDKRVLPKRFNTEIDLCPIFISLKGKPEHAKLHIYVQIWVAANGEVDGPNVGGEGAWLDWSVSGAAKLETLLKTVPPFIEWCLPEEDREGVYAALEELGVGFCRPVVPHEELHGDRREGYDE
jgi:hypothetical protein